MTSSPVKNVSLAQATTKINIFLSKSKPFILPESAFNTGFNGIKDEKILWTAENFGNLCLGALYPFVHFCLYGSPYKGSRSSAAPRCRFPSVVMLTPVSANSSVARDR